MRRPHKSITVIGLFLAVNALVWSVAFESRGKSDWGKESEAVLRETPTMMRDLDYFHIRGDIPLLSLAATSMEGMGDQQAFFRDPRGVYTVGEKQQSMLYEAREAEYIKASSKITMQGEVKLDYQSTHYEAARMIYYLKKDLLLGRDQVKVRSLDPKTKNVLLVNSDRMQAKPKQHKARFIGTVKGSMTPPQRFKEPMFFTAGSMELDGPRSQATLKQDVGLKRGEMLLSAQNADLFMENQNKKLKYFVMNDDVKMTETFLDRQGRKMQRHAWAERLEGFGQEERLVLSGAPRVEQGRDVVKGYRITLRENMEFIEVEDAMSDVEVVRKKEKK